MSVVDYNFLNFWDSDGYKCLTKSYVAGIVTNNLISDMFLEISKIHCKFVADIQSWSSKYTKIFLQDKHEYGSCKETLLSLIAKEREKSQQFLQFTKGFDLNLLKLKQLDAGFKRVTPNKLDLQFKKAQKTWLIAVKDYKKKMASKRMDPANHYHDYLISKQSYFSRMKQLYDKCCQFEGVRKSVVFSCFKQWNLNNNYNVRNFDIVADLRIFYDHVGFDCNDFPH